MLWIEFQRAVEQRACFIPSLGLEMTASHQVAIVSMPVTRGGIPAGLAGMFEIEYSH
jgi:hypothetical protein